MITKCPTATAPPGLGCAANIADNLIPAYPGGGHPLRAIGRNSWWPAGAIRRTLEAATGVEAGRGAP